MHVNMVNQRPVPVPCEEKVPAFLIQDDEKILLRAVVERFSEIEKLLNGLLMSFRNNPNKIFPILK